MSGDHPLTFEPGSPGPFHEAIAARPVEMPTTPGLVGPPLAGHTDGPPVLWRDGRWPRTASHIPVRVSGNRFRPDC